MKVLSYLEIMSQEGYWEDYVPEFIELKIRFCSPQLNDFYSQPFKPEMITELFAEWQLSEVTFNYTRHRVCIQFKTFVRSGLSYMYIDKPDNQGETFKLLRPRTLDDFINDATRTGIELEWKK
jgi:hypothetical protein